MASVYIAPEVAEMIELYPYLTDQDFIALPIHARLKRQAETLCAAHRRGDTGIRMQVMSWWPGAAGKSLADVLAAPFSDADAVSTLCREHGFADWSAVKALGDFAPDPTFEQALDLMLSGARQPFAALLEEHPRLVSATSRFGHQATLLHYVGANGVESQRQVTPLNAVEMAERLIAKGALTTAKANMYGGEQTPYALAGTSAHPHNAGLAPKLNAVLQVA